MSVTYSSNRSSWVVAKQRFQTTFDWSLSFWTNAALATVRFTFVIEQGKEEPPNNAANARRWAACKRSLGVKSLATLHLMVGLPCSGKTTLAKQLEHERSALRLTPDEWQVALFGQDAEEPEHDARHSLI